MRVFLLDSDFSNNGLYSLKSRDKQYLNKVLRLVPGIRFTAKDKYNNYYTATLVDPSTLSLEKSTTPEETLLDNLSAYHGEFANITMYISLLKGKKLEPVIRALTEIGVRKIITIRSEFVQEDELSSHQKERLDLIIKEAVQQSGAKQPELSGPIDFKDAINDCYDIKLIMHQGLLNSSKNILEVLKDQSITSSVACFIGPEGGFSDHECLLAEKNNAIPVLLNTNILRAETAAIYSASVIQALLNK